MKVGTRVRFKGWAQEENVENSSRKKGALGTTLDTNSSPYVRWDVKGPGMHDCNGLCEHNHGYSVHESLLEELPAEEIAGMCKIDTVLEGKLTVGGYTLIRQAEGKIWIRDDASGEGGEFSAGSLERLIKDFYGKNL